MSKTAKKWIMNLVKVAIAVIGLWYVISTTPWENRAVIDHTRLKDDKGNVAELWGAVLLEDVQVALPDPGGRIAINRELIHVRFPHKPVSVARDNKTTTELLGQPQPDGTIQPEVDIPRKYLQLMKDSTEPRIEVGVKQLIQTANIPRLFLAFLFLLLPFVVTAWRWMKLMQPQGIALPYFKCLALTFVGQFYSTFLPGSVSGDAIKIIYTSKVTGSKTKSIVTVLLDRVIGLIALMLIAGIAAAFQLWDPKTGSTMRNVVIMVAGIFLCLTVGSIIYFSKRLRGVFGLTRLLEHPKVPEFVRHADEVLHAYHGHRGILVTAFIAAMIAQLAIPMSAWMAGTAFGIGNANIGHYLAYVPLATLASALPISFLGLGVMDSVVFHFFYSKGLADASQTFALAQAIRFLPIIWNMLGAYWVVTGTYSRHQAMEEDRKEGPSAAVDVLDKSLDPGM